MFAHSETKSSAKSTVLPLAKGFRVLEVFGSSETELVLNQIARKAGLDPGTTFRLVKTLVMLGYLRQVYGAKRYRLGLKVLDLGFHAIGRMSSMWNACRRDWCASVLACVPPPEYDRTRYLGYIDDWKAGRMGKLDPGRPESGAVLRAFTIAPIPNRKTDVNMAPRLGYTFAEENFEYPEANWEKREKITERLRNITLGLLFFLQNDPAVPAGRDVGQPILAAAAFQAASLVHE